ncbi:uncharacterized protein LOC143347849 [Colletes latitarsis]|uniref:uncharacterized protein LOC143347849 n=1 Tax=Colletes latitarsis TaxID=2605962 RepID=UPI0040365EC0
MKVDTTSIKVTDPLVLTERLLRVGGNWPLQHSSVMFKFVVVYYPMVLVLQYWELAYCLGDLGAVALNLEETLATTTMYCGFLVVARNRKHLREAIIMMKTDIANETIFRNDEEKRLYFRYNITSRRIGRFVAWLSISVLVTLYCLPMKDMVASFVRGIK